MICVFGKNDTSYRNPNYTGNGLCVLDPYVCIVSETAGGSYELHMEHPIDENGKFAYLIEDAIIRAPVPEANIPAITMPATTQWKTKTDTDPTKKYNLYSKLPVYKSTGVTKDDLSKVRQNPTYYLWDSEKTYKPGALVVSGIRPSFSGYIYKAKKENKNIQPMSDFTVWDYLGKVEASSPSEGLTEYTPGVVVEMLAQSVTVIKIADYNSNFLQVKAPSGNKGYISRNDVELLETPHAGETYGPYVIKEQYFRIYSVQGEDDTHAIIVDAKHISYDFVGNKLLECKVTQADPQAAIANIQGALAYADEEPDRIIACNITGQKVTQDWSYQNPVSALLDPDDGVVPKLKAKLVRNNQNFFILDGSNPQKGISIDYGVNMCGVSWTKNTEDVITRVIPRCSKAKNEYLYIEDLYVDSPKYTAHPTDYPVIKTEVLNCNYAVGKEYTPPEGGEPITMDEDQCKTQMAADAAARFSKDKIDDPEITLDVEFVLLGDTEEYKQYRGLQSVNLYDEISVNTGHGVFATAQVTEYEFDSILERYNSIRVSNVSQFIRKVSGFSVNNAAIGLNKLTKEVIDEIRTGGDSLSENSGSQDDGTPSGGGGTTDIVVVNALDSTSTTDALSANMGKALKDYYDDVNKIEDKQVTRVGTYFTERTAFKARRVGNSIVIMSYVNITTAVPAGTQFADTGFSAAEGVYLFVGGDGANPRVVLCSGGKLRPDAIIPTGYYYVVGCALMKV